MGEDAKVALRQIRHKVMDFIKKEIKDGYPEDMGKKKEADVDKMVHSHSEAVDHLIHAKGKGYHDSVTISFGINTRKVRMHIRAFFILPPMP